ncbi:bifunctional lysine-specific demethylase and histidyl-hydroxylase NO66 [Folsomia candida]|nr:bifunctional lysine-specific demethylase and histidyl-hydroxylase NO66 [Folsomia candida]XP_035715316.1 bifunctional lysine-specific demethylase and histidyl-hydroxylase NO66 [Folsomia candida]
MVRNYVRKTEDKWTKEDLLDALTNIKDSKIKINDAAKEYQISRATLYRQFKKFLQAGGKIDVNQFKTCGGNPILSKIEEDVLVKTILDLREQGYTVTSTDIKRICYEYCDTNGIPNQFNAEKRLASDDWYYGYLKRHPEIRTIDPSAPVPAPKATKKSKTVVKTEPLILVKQELASNGHEVGEEEVAIAVAAEDDGPSTSAAAAAKSATMAAAGTKRKASPKKGGQGKKAKQDVEGVEEVEQEINGEGDANGEEEVDSQEEVIEEVHTERDEAEDEGDDEEALEEEEEDEGEGENGHDEEVDDEEQGEVEEDDQVEQEEGVEEEEEDGEQEVEDEDEEQVEEEEEPAEKPVTGHMGTRSPKK